MPSGIPLYLGTTPIALLVAEYLHRHTGICCCLLHLCPQQGFSSRPGWLVTSSFYSPLTLVPHPPGLCHRSTALQGKHFRLHGIHQDIVSDRGPLFVLQVWKSFSQVLRTTACVSSGYHPQSNVRRSGPTRIWRQLSTVSPVIIRLPGPPTSLGSNMLIILWFPLPRVCWLDVAVPSVQHHLR